eukprot:360194-Chlamydomonas_euryale.AAC.13
MAMDGSRGDRVHSRPVAGMGDKMLAASARMGGRGRCARVAAELSSGHFQNCLGCSCSPFRMLKMPMGERGNRLSGASWHGHSGVRRWGTQAKAAR